MYNMGPEVSGSSFHCKPSRVFPPTRGTFVISGRLSTLSLRGKSRMRAALQISHPHPLALTLIPSPAGPSPFALSANAPGFALDRLFPTRSTASIPGGVPPASIQSSPLPSRPHPHSLSRRALTLCPLPGGEGKLVRIHISVEAGRCALGRALVHFGRKAVRITFTWGSSGGRSAFRLTCRPEGRPTETRGIRISYTSRATYRGTRNPLRLTCRPEGRPTGGRGIW
jgi:hypothetical protein